MDSYCETDADQTLSPPLSSRAQPRDLQCAPALHTTQWLKPDLFQQLYVRPKGRTLHKVSFSAASLVGLGYEINQRFLEETRQYLVGR